MSFFIEEIIPDKWICITGLRRSIGTKNVNLNDWLFLKREPESNK